MGDDTLQPQPPSRQQRRTSIATIFNPRKQKSGASGSSQGPYLGPRPSVVVTDEDTPYPIQLTNGGESLRGYASPRGSFGRMGRSGSFNLVSFSHHNEGDTGSSDGKEAKISGLQKIKRCIFSVTTRKILVGIIVTFCVTSSWVGASHLFKDLFIQRSSDYNGTTLNILNLSDYYYQHHYETGHLPGDLIFDAPFFATWFCTAWTGLFFPLYLLGHTCLRQEKTTVKSALKTIAQNFRDRGLTFGKYFSRCIFFCFLWVGSNYMYVNSLRILDCTDVMALYSTHIAFVYLLAWVILHEQFVGVRIVAVIMCNTGIALLAYMDGVARTQTLLGVVLAAASAAGTAIFKVLFRKVVGEVSFGQIGLFFTGIAFLNTLIFSPLVVVLILTGYEKVLWFQLPWKVCLLIAALYLVANLLAYFGLAVTFEVFITLGFIISVPVSGALDVLWYRIAFKGMKLAGIVLIACGFFLVLFPANWPQYLSKILRWGRHRKRRQHRHISEPVDYRTGLISRSHLRSPSGMIR
ncbi:UNVERIFIED_CONTAM: hypothetical protein RMT77_005053 [Armadillidium vulgare]